MDVIGGGQVNAAAYLQQLQALLPPGAAWSRERDATLTALLDALAQELAHVDVEAESLVDEADPRTTAQLLTDWERVAGLPDVCVTATQTTAERRDALVQKIANLGGQSRQFFIDLAARLGYTITITEFHPFQVGESAVGDALNGDPWIFAWQVNAPAGQIREFKVGESAVGDPLRSWGDELLECVIERLKPAHTHVIFAYA